MAIDTQAAPVGKGGGEGGDGSCGRELPRRELQPVGIGTGGLTGSREGWAVRGGRSLSGARMRRRVAIGPGRPVSQRPLTRQLHREQYRSGTRPPPSRQGMRKSSFNRQE